ncbi:MAG: SPOR domain-containing protein [Acetobacter papayae]
MDEKERSSATADDRINRARERMSTDYDDTPAKPEAALLGSMLARVTGTDSITRWLAYGAAGLGGLLVLGIGGWALVRHHSHGIPVLGPPAVAMKTHPVDPGGMQLDALGPTEETDDQTGHPVPAPEKPNPAALAAQYGGTAATPAGASTGEAPAPAGAQTPDASPATSAGTASGAPAHEEEETDSTAPGAVEEGDSAAAGQSAAQGATPAAPAAATPAPSPAAQPAKPAAEAPARNTAVPAPAARQAEAPLPAPVPAASAVKGSGGYQVQLAALQSDAEARKEWSRLKTRYPTLFGARTPSIVRTEQSSAVFYRLRVAGFDSSADAHAFCATARERGLACMVARP